MMMQIENHNTESATSEKKQMNKGMKRMLKEKVDTAKQRKKVKTNKQEGQSKTNKQKR